jgi:hypothetical protein
VNSKTLLSHCINRWKGQKHTMDPIEIRLQEYNAIRQEILAAMNGRNSILSFGLAAVGAIFAASIAAFEVGTFAFLSVISLVLVIPAICGFILCMWLGEYERKERAGSFLVNLEKTINVEASKPLLTWEGFLRGERRKMEYPYIATVMLLTGVSLISLILGLVMTALSLDWQRISPVALVGGAIVVMGVIGVIVHIVVCKKAVSRMAVLRSSDESQRQEP